MRRNSRMKVNNKTRKVVAKSIVLCVLIAVLGIAMNHMQKSKQSPAEHITETTQANAESEKSDSEKDTEEIATTQTVTTENQSDTEWREIAGDNILNLFDIKVECLSCDIVHGSEIATQTKYPAEYFQNGIFPGDDGVTGEELTDWDAVYAEAPELEEIHSAKYGVYTQDEILAANAKYQDVIDKYTTVEGSGDVDYYFVKCRATSEDTEEYAQAMNYQYSMCMNLQYKTSDGETKGYYDTACCYFDKATHTEADDRKNYFYFVTLHPGDEIEFTIGFAVENKYGDDQICYIGNPPTGDEEYDPDMVPDYVKLDNIPEASN